MEDIMHGTEYSRLTESPWALLIFLMVVMIFALAVVFPAAR